MMDEMIKFIIGGRRIDPDKIGDGLMEAAIESIAADIEEKIRSVRDPKTGEFPAVVVTGDSLDNLRISVEGSPEVIALVEGLLGTGLDDEERVLEGTEGPPRVFLSYATDDSVLAEQIATSLNSSGIDTWWDKWCIGPGDSLRQKIDEGLLGCTHFLVLLTPRSIIKPWVNQEIDAGLVRKLNNQCHFLPIRYELPASQLPPLLSGMNAPEIKADRDVSQLINDIHGISRKPTLGPAPLVAAQATETKTGYSPAANAIAKLFVEKTKHARFADPQFSVEELANETGLTVPDTKDGLHELWAFFRDSRDHVLVEASLFAEFDQYWKPWKTADDALKLAADIGNDPDFPSDCQLIADRYGWDSRRLNPSITYLLEWDVIDDYQAIGLPQFTIARVVGKEDEVRRFVKSRQ